MGDEVREYVRAAQAAELRGDHTEAAELLFKAAYLYKSAGRSSRALSLLRHAQKLDGSREDVAEEIRRLEWLPDQAMQRALAPDESLDEEMRRVMAPLEDASGGNDQADIHGAPPPGQLPGKPPRAIPERGPALSDAAQEAWCSFCCRPSREVGQLVAGAAGAFVCNGCVRTSVTLLGGASVEILPPEEAPASVVEAPAAREAFVLPHQAAAKRELEGALSLGLRRLLLLGEPGAGKSSVLKLFADEGKGRLLTGATVTAHPPDEALLLIDSVEGLDAQGWLRLAYHLEKHPGPAIVAMRGTAPEAAAHALTEDARVAIAATASLIEATAGKLPVDFAEALDGVVALGATDEDALRALGAHLLVSRGFPAPLVDGTSDVVTQQARSSGRLLHEVVALVRRVPPGAWRMEAPEAKAAAKRPKKAARKKGGA